MSPSSPAGPGVRPASSSRSVCTVTRLETTEGVPPCIVCRAWTPIARTAGQRSTRGAVSGSTSTPQGTMAMGTSRIPFRARSPRASADRPLLAAATPSASRAMGATAPESDCTWLLLLQSMSPSAPMPPALAATASAAGPGPGISQT